MVPLNQFYKMVIEFTSIDRSLNGVMSLSVHGISKPLAWKTNKFKGYTIRNPFIFTMSRMGRSIHITPLPPWNALLATQHKLSKPYVRRSYKLCATNQNSTI